MIVARIILPWAKTSELSMNARTHWRKRHRLVKSQKRTATALALEAGLHKVDISDDAEIRVHLYACPAPSTPWPDDDNFKTAQKGALDAIADVLRVNDSRFRLQPVQRGDRCASGAVIVEIEIEVK